MPHISLPCRPGRGVLLAVILVFAFHSTAAAQTFPTEDEVIKQMWEVGIEQSQVEELAHVLMNSGDHSDRPGNLMRDETAAANRTLTAAQCGRLRDVGTRHGLLREVGR